MTDCLLSIFTRTRRGRSIQSSSGKKTFTQPSSNCLKVQSFLCSIEVSQEITEDASPEEVEPQYDCGKSVCIISIWSSVIPGQSQNQSFQEKPNIEDVACGLELPKNSADEDNHNCFWHFLRILFSYCGPDAPKFGKNRL